MKAKFEKENCNSVRLEQIQNGKNVITYITIPPGKNRIDLYDTAGININTGYFYKFEGFAIISSSNKRMIFYKGELLDECEL